MKEKQTKNLRILAIAPSTRGFSFAVFEGPENLVGCGGKSVFGNKNARCLEELEEKINYYHPHVLVLEDALAEGSLRSLRIRKLYQKIIALASSRKLRVKTFSRKEWRQMFFDGAQGSKQAVAEILAKRFPVELGPILPPKRKLWMSEDYQMPVFDAVALAVAFGS